MKAASLLAKLANTGGAQDGPPDASHNLPDETFSGARFSSVVAPEGFLALIESMREQGKYDFADETLRGIYDTVEKTKTVTEAQHRAVYNIRHSQCGSCRRHRGFNYADEDED